MGCLLFTLTTLLSFHFIPVIFCAHIITPNFTASNLQFVEDHGGFIYSPNNTYKASIYNPGEKEATNFYLCVIHIESNTIIWVANRNNPISKFGKMLLSSNGLVISDENGEKIWSTLELHSSVSAMMLTDMGNLLLVDQKNVSLWDSFDYPSDTIVIRQNLRVGNLLTSSFSDTDMSDGNYSLSVTDSDVLLQWYGSTYWKLSMETHASRNSNHVIENLMMDEKGLYLFGRNGSIVVMQVNLPASDFRVAKVDKSGQFIVQSYVGGTNWKQEFIGPDNSCEIPYICGRIGLCVVSAASNGPACSCPSGFRVDPQQEHGCIPSDSSFSLPNACNSSNNRTLDKSQKLSYIGLGSGKSYFGNTFLNPDKYGVELSDCQDFCSADCSCLGVFHSNASGTCLLVRNQLGSIMSNVASGNKQLGYIKTLITLQKPNGNANSSGGRKRLSVLALVIFPIIGLILVAAVAFIGWRRWRKRKIGLEDYNYADSTSSGEMEAFSIPGLPVRYDFDELKIATDNFKTQIGSGGFGSVYKGVLPDKTVVAVKKITNLGVQGKKDFCTEIAVIGSVHHMNLVKLKGFCAEAKQRLLVYEYMNHGSLDRTLFGNGPVLEWQERFDIALGTARGLAYLHSGCEQKIIHCDVKPENILLQDHFQPKISDFGLSKLLNPEQSSHFTTMRGTRGYLAPEWLTRSAISEKTDVYSYGMVLLELVSGRKNCSPRQQSHSLDDNTSTGGNSSGSSGTGLVYFPMFALEMHEQGRYLDLADPRLQDRVTSEEVEKLVCIALCCVHEEPILRPNMVTVVGMLEGTIQWSIPRLESLNFLRFYGRRFAEPSVLASGDQQLSAIGGGGVYSSVSYVSSEEVSGPR